MLGPFKIFRAHIREMLGPFETIGNISHEKCWAHLRSSAAYLMNNAGPV
jgi:hypothetical protein